MKKFILSLALVSIFASPLAHASGRVLEAEGYKITLNYEITAREGHSNKPSSGHVANPVSVRIDSAKLSANDVVKVVFVNTQVQRGYCGIGSYSYETVCRMDTDRKNGFQAELRDSLVKGPYDKDWMTFTQAAGYGNHGVVTEFSGYCYTGYGTLEVAVAIGEHWLTDPLNGTHNFQVNL